MARKKSDGWDVSAVLWRDACSSMEEPLVTPTWMLTFGIVQKEQEREFWRVFGNVGSLHGGEPDMATAIPTSMTPQIIKVMHVPIPPEFKQYWTDIACE